MKKTQGVPTCKIDGSPIGPGGSKSTRLCARCYKRDQRGVAPSAEHKRAANGEAARVTVAMPKELLGLVEGCADLEGVSVPEWIRGAMRDRVMQMARGRG